MKLQSRFLIIAMRLQEAETADGLTNKNVASRLDDQIQDMHRNTGHYANYLDHIGDDSAGHVIYSVDGNTVKAPYELSGGGGTAAKCMIDSDKAVNVVPRTVYEPEDDQDELDQYAQMTEAKLYTRGRVRVMERAIPKSERDAASSGSFAGKGKSFPILKPEDVQAAFHALGRAGSSNYSTDVIRKNIIRIAKAKGWSSSLPKSAQEDGDEKTKEAKGAKTKDCPTCSGSGDCPDCDGDGKVDAKESQGRGGSELRLVESGTVGLDEIPLTESTARTSYPIKLISPGTGASAHYPAKVLEASADKFKAGTLMFWNHPTKREENERPEGDLNNLAAITTTPARWEANGKHGAGLYAEAKVMSDYAEKLAERAPHIGVSIRAGGKGTGRLVDGKPELKSIDYVESVDYVTAAGRGGIALAEAARNAGLLPANDEGGGMTAEEKQQLREAVGISQSLLEKERRREAIAEGARVLRDVALGPDAKEYIIETVLREAVPVKNNAIDLEKFRESINAEARRFGAAIGAGPRVVGMGVAAPAAETAEQKTLREAAEKAVESEYKDSWQYLLGGDVKLAEAALKGREAA